MRTPVPTSNIKNKFKIDDLFYFYGKKRESYMKTYLLNFSINTFFRISTQCISVLTLMHTCSDSYAKELIPLGCWESNCIEISEDLMASKKSILSSLKKTLTIIKKNSVLHSRLPKKWSILVDSSWSRTPGGYTSLSLHDSKGNSAILITPSSIQNDIETTAIVVHEAAHLAHLTIKPNEESWILEGLALLFEELVVHRPSPYVYNGFIFPETSLTASLDVHQSDYRFGESEAAQYGHLAQYFSYIYRLCGQSTLINNLLDSKNSKTGISLMDEVLPASSDQSLMCKDFKSSFKAFSLARIKGSQNSWDKNESIFLSQQPITIRECPIQKLPSWSTSVYRLRSPSCTQKPKTKCETNEIPWGASRCIQIHYSEKDFGSHSHSRT